MSCAVAIIENHGTLIPHRDVDCEKRNYQRGFESLETIDGGRHEGNRSSIVEEVAGHEIMVIDPMKVADQRLTNVESMWYGQRWSRFLRSSSLSCGASGRGGVLESELIGDTTGKLNIIYVVTFDDILIPWYVFTLAYLTLVTADCGWDTVVLVRAHSLLYFLCCCPHVILEPQEHILGHCWYTGDAAGKTDVEKGVM